MLGLVSFVNKLKAETQQVIERLRGECGIDVKMITGDNVYTAVQTAFSSGIILPTERVLQKTSSTQSASRLLPLPSQIVLGFSTKR